VQQECPNCDYRNIPGRIYCSNCSNQLGEKKGILAKSLEEKLQWLDDKDISFQAKYRGKGEVFTAGPVGLGFLDVHWLENVGDRGQEIKPSDIERIVDETIKAEKDSKDPVEEPKDL
jgi:hypothetical protein